MHGPSPDDEFPCDPLSRRFPIEWRDVAFRLSAVDGVYECPLCKEKFDYRRLGELECDHFWPYSLFGETSWENFRLICKPCNARKGNRLESHIRSALAQGAFRELVIEFLRKAIPPEVAAGDPFLRELLRLG